MKLTLLIPLLAVIGFCSLHGFSQTRGFDVQVEITAKNKEVQDTLESYILRELRSLGDVNIVTAKPLLSLKIVVLETRNQNQETVNVYALSVAATRSVACTIGGRRRTCELFEDQALYTNTADKLRAVCEEIVTDFDIRHLKDLRKK